jgi:DNA repair exonuclease SbcCD ATPase subunit
MHNKTAKKTMASFLSVSVFSILFTGFQANARNSPGQLKERYAGLPKEATGIMPSFEENHKPLLDMYARLYQGYKHLAELRRTFGKRHRRAAAREVKSIERNISRAYQDFIEQLGDVLSVYEEGREELKQQIMKIEKNVDLTDPKSITQMRDKTADSRKEIQEYEKKIVVLKAMGTSLAELQEEEPTIYTFLKTSDRSYRTVDIEEFEDLIDVFYEFKDAQADLERMQANRKEKAKDWSPMDNRQLQRLESDLNEAREDTLEELKDMREPLLDDQEDLQEDLDKLQERKARASERRQKRYQEDIDEIETELEKLTERLVLLKKFEDALGASAWK